MFRTAAIMLAIVVCCVAPLGANGPARAMARQATPSADCPVTTEAENRAIIERYYDAVSAFDLDALAEVLAPVVIQHAADVEDAVGIEQFQANIGLFLDAFPDLTHEIEQIMTDGDLVAARVVQAGTQEADFLGIPASGRHATWTVIGIWRIECGRIAEHWVEVDQVGRLQQLGAFPPIGQAAGTPAAEPADTMAVDGTPESCPATTEAENTDLVRRWYDEVWTKGDLSHLDELIAPNHVDHGLLTGRTTGAEARAGTIADWRAALPDLEARVDVLLTDGDRVVARWIATGTHEGEWQGVEPTGNRVTWTGNTIFRFDCGRIAEEWSEASSLAFLQQLGITAGPPAPLPEATPDE